MTQPLDIIPVTLDFNRKYLNEISSVQGDTGRVIEFTIVKSGKPIDLTGEDVRIFGIKPDGNRIFNDATITNPASGKCLVELTPQMLAVAGTVYCNLARYKGGKRFSSMKFEIFVDENVADNLDIESTSEYLALTDALNLIKGSVNAEIVDARGTYNTLGKRLDKFDEKIQTIDDKKIRKFKPNLGFCPWFLDNSMEILRSNVKVCAESGIDSIQLALHVALNNNNLYIKEDMAIVKTIAREYENNGIKIKMLKLHCKDVNSTFKNTDEFNTKYIDIIRSVCNEFNEFTIDYLIVLNEEEENIYSNMDKQTFILNCIDAGQKLGFKTGITTTNFYFMNTKVTDTVKNKCDVLGVNHYQPISNKEDKTTFEDSLNTWKNGLVEFNIKSLKQKYNKEIIITETGVQDNWCALISPGIPNWTTIKKSNYKAVSIYLYGMLETLKNCDELSGIYIWYSINNSEVIKLLSSYTKGVI